MLEFRKMLVEGESFEIAEMDRRLRWERISSEDSRRKHEAPLPPPPRHSWLRMAVHTQQP